MVDIKRLMLGCEDGMCLKIRKEVCVVRIKWVSERVVSSEVREEKEVRVV